MRRVATLVARGVAPAEVFDAVVAEMHLLLGAGTTSLLRYEPDGVPPSSRAAASEARRRFPVGARYTVEGDSVSAAVMRSGRPEPADSFEGPPGSIAAEAKRLGIRSAAGAPILVEGRLWGVIDVGWRWHRPVAGIEDRIAQFTELVGHRDLKRPGPGGPRRLPGADRGGER